MSSPEFEIFLAKLYADPTTFGPDLHQAALDFGLTPEQAQAIAAIDRDALSAAAASFQKKREGKRPARRRSILDRLWGH